MRLPYVALSYHPSKCAVSPSPYPVAERVRARRSWPTIGELRGKILFVADPGYISDYNTAFPNLTNAVMFTSDGAAPHASLALTAHTYSYRCVRILDRHI